MPVYAAMKEFFLKLFLPMSSAGYAVDYLLEFLSIELPPLYLLAWVLGGGEQSQFG